MLRIRGERDRLGEDEHCEEPRLLTGESMLTTFRFDIESASGITIGRGKAGSICASKVMSSKASLRRTLRKRSQITLSFVSLKGVDTSPQAGDGAKNSKCRYSS